MPVGPFDARSKRSRCSSCASSHLKCDSQKPCNHCQRRGISCVYGAKRALIQLGNAKVSTVTTFKPNDTATVSYRRSPALLGAAPSSDPTPRHLYFFRTFLQHNHLLAGRGGSCEDDVQALVPTDLSRFLLNAVTALGALQSSRVNPPTHRQDHSFAIQAYSASLAGLRVAMSSCDLPSRLHVLWTTLFLGLFELMIDETGEGWQLHMVHGTARALQSSGASAFRSGPGRSFFLHARIFEISRAMLLSDSTFLSETEWQDLSSEDDAQEGVLEPPALGSLLNTIVQCSRLRIQTGDLIHSLDDSGYSDLKAAASELAAQGIRLRNDLDDWDQQRNKVPSPAFLSPKAKVDEEALLAHVFFSAISIYLSGVFDYDILHWRAWNFAVPTIAENRIQAHVDSILDVAVFALETTALSPLLFLFSLRIAGARSYEARQRQKLLSLLGRISGTFTVARTFRSELQEVWRERDKMAGDLGLLQA